MAVKRSYYKSAENRIVDASQLSEALGEVLNDYGMAVVKGTKEEAKLAIDKLVKDTKATAPVGHRRNHHYKSSITSKKEWESAVGVGYLWYVKGSDYRLSHLLEHGHALRQGGRVNGTGFIKKASDAVIEEYLKNIEEVLKNG